MGWGNFAQYVKIEYKKAKVFWLAKERQKTSTSSVRSSNTFNKNINKHSITSAKRGQYLAVSWLLYTNSQNKTLGWLLCMNLKSKVHDRRVTPFPRSQKSQHKYILSNSGWKLSPIINKGGGERSGKIVVWLEKNRKIN